MNADQVQSLIRSVLLAGGTILAEHGVAVSADQWTAIVGGVMAAISVIWSQWFHSKTA